MFQGVHFGGIVVADRAIHETADGRRFLVIHGDQFDTVVHNARWLAYLGDRAYDLPCSPTGWSRASAQLFGLPYWSFSSWAKVKVKKAVNFIGAFQDVLTEEARRSRCRRRHLRPYPPCRDRGLRRRRIHQHRRLGGKLHGGGRAFRRHGWRSSTGRMCAPSRRPARELRAGADRRPVGRSRLRVSPMLRHLQAADRRSIRICCRAGLNGRPTVMPHGLACSALSVRHRPPHRLVQQVSPMQRA